MNIENEIFKKSNVNFDKLEEYGFIRKNKAFIYEYKFLNDDFKAVINIDDKGIVTGKVIDLQINEEYTNIRTEMSGEFVNKVRECYKNILEDIRKKCFDTKYFINNQSNRIANYIINKYLTEPEFLWDKFPAFGVFRKKDSGKWYALISNVDFSKLDDKTGEVEIINVKLDKNKIQLLLNKKGYYEAYHMSKKDWITIILNDTLKDNEIIRLVDESYKLVK